MAPPQSTDLELAARLKKGDSRALREAYNAYSKKLYPVCLRYMGNEMAAQDALQDAFIRIFERIGQYRGDGPLGGWMRTVVVTMCLQHIRAQKAVWVELGHEAEAASTSPFDALNDLAATDLLRLIQQLPNGYREVFNLHAIEGYRHDEVAEMLGISEANSKVRLNRARQMLQNKVEPIRMG